MCKKVLFTETLVIFFVLIPQTLAIALPAQYIISQGVKWNTFLGGTSYDSGTSIATDSDGFIYITGASYASWGAPINGFSGSDDVFVAKLDARGNLVWNTFLGGPANDYGYGIAVDGDGNTYVSGYSAGTWGSPVNPYAAGSDGFVAKLDSNGTLLWNTFVGGSGSDLGLDVSVDTNHCVFVVGYSTVAWGTPIRPFSGANDAFIAKLNEHGVLQWGNFLGGVNGDGAYGVTTDSNGDAYVVGWNNSSWGSPVRAYSGGEDILIAKVEGAGSLEWNTCLGGGGNDEGWGITVDLAGNVYVTGTSSAGWASPIRPFSGGDDAIAAKFNPSGVLQWNTFLGGSATDLGHGIDVSQDGSIYIAGYSSSTWGTPSSPFVPAAYDPYITGLNFDGSLEGLLFFGGSDYGVHSDVVVGHDGGVLVVGQSLSWGSPIRSYTSGADVYVAKIGAGVRVDFNNDGQEDIFWRYYGAGGYNRAWYLGNMEGAGPMRSLGVAVASDSNMAGSQPKDNLESRAPANKRATGQQAERFKVISPRSIHNPMAAKNRQTRSRVVNDPRLAGGVFAKPSGMSIADPRLVNLGYEMPISPDIKLTSTPSVLGGGDVMPVGGLTWQIVGTGDFNNDTRVDILWRNTSNGSNVVWYMDGVNWTGSAALITVPDQSWKIVGTGDFNHDTHVDILWRNTSTGLNLVWYMNGADWIGSAEVLGVGDSAWQIVGTGDFNKDGNVDILWRYGGAGGYDVVWHMNGVNWGSSAELIHVGDLTWQIAGTGDYDNDGNVDILWRYNGAGGYNVIWYMTGADWRESAELIPVPDLNWKIVSR